MKRLCLLILLVMAVFPAHAQSSAHRNERRVTFGVEWNYIASFHCGIHHNFFSEVGYRVDLKDQLRDFRNNGDLSLHCGYNLSDKWNLSVYSGIAGVYDINRIIPITLRASRFFRPDRRGDRWFSFIDAGSGITLTAHPQATASGKLGCGYRLSLSEVSKLDFILAYRMTLTRPELEFDGHPINIDKINRNNAYTSALSLGIALTF